MNTKHTPGPWTPDVQCGDVRSPVGDVAVAVYAGMRSIGITGKEATLAKITRCEAEANARLIAAAPMLLEANIAEQAAQTYYDDIGSNEAYAAMRVLYGLGYSGENDARTPSEFASQLRRAAIAAATGETK